MLQSMGPQRGRQGRETEQHPDHSGGKQLRASPADVFRLILKALMPFQLFPCDKKYAHLGKGKKQSY